MTKVGDRVDSIGTCVLCGYHGPGPKHDCIPKEKDNPLDTLSTGSLETYRGIWCGVEIQVQQRPDGDWSWYAGRNPRRMGSGCVKHRKTAFALAKYTAELLERNNER